MIQFLFYIVPFPLKLLTEHYQRGQTWIGANFLPLILGLFHFAIASNALCFAFRLQLLLNYVRRCRRWNSLGWVAWRKICWIIPFGIIANVSLCFEFNLDYEICVLGNRTHAIGIARLSEAVKRDATKLEFIRATPTIIYWLTALFSITFLLSERCILPKLSSPYASKHIPLFSNLRPILTALLLAHAPVHVIYTYDMFRGVLLSSATKHTLYGISYSLLFPMMFILSRAFRCHILHILTKYFQGRTKGRRSGSTIRRVTKHITSVAFSKLEMENSELDERFTQYKTQNYRSVLKEDAIYRIKFAMPQRVEMIAEEEESSEKVLDPTEGLDIESAEFLQRQTINE